MPKNGRPVPELVIVVPLTTTDCRWPHHVHIRGADVLARPSFAMTEQPRTIARSRIAGRAGTAGADTLADIDQWLRDFTDLWATRFLLHRCLKGQTGAMTSWVLHMDLDQFIAAVEVLRRPELAGKPVVVGGRGDPTERGVVSTASYEARKFGVGSGMPLRVAARKLPDAVFLPVDAPAYEATSVQVMDTLRSLDAVVEVLGWDEAFLAVETDDPEEFAHEIQRSVVEAARLHCSVGIGDNKLRAKIATEFGKPQGMFRLTEDNWYNVMADRSTDALWGIGRKTAKRLAGLEITTVRELAEADAQWLADQLGPTMGPWYRRLARGIDSSPVVGTPYLARSHGRESTFQQNLTDWAEVEAEVRRLAREVTDDIRRDDRPAIRVGVKVRFAPFDTHTRSLTLDAATFDGDLVEEAAIDLVNRFDTSRAIRLLGVRAEMTPPVDPVP